MVESCEGLRTIGKTLHTSRRFAPLHPILLLQPLTTDRIFLAPLFQPNLPSKAPSAGDAPSVSRSFFHRRYIWPAAKYVSTWCWLHSQSPLEGAVVVLVQPEAAQQGIMVMETCDYVTGLVKVWCYGRYVL